jgi:hypothetical protein
MAQICLVDAVVKAWLKTVSSFKTFLKVQNAQKCENLTFLIFLIRK